MSESEMSGSGSLVHLLEKDNHSIVPHVLAQKFYPLPYSIILLLPHQPALHFLPKEARRKNVF